MACRSPHRALLAVVAVNLLLWTTSGSAQAQSADVASSLFQQARSKMEVGDFTAACPLLDESFRQDPKPGTLFTLANCRDREGKLAAASGRYGEYIRTVDAMAQAPERKRHAERRDMAEKRLQELEKEVPTLKLVWQGGFPSDVKVRIDEVDISTTTLGLALPFDPGEHIVQIRRPGYSDFSRRLELKKGTSVEVDLSTWESPKSSDGSGSSDGASSGNEQSSSSGGSGRKQAGFVFLGLGGAGLAFGGIMGTLAVLEKQTVTDHCTGPQGLNCDKEGIAAVDNMRTYALPSTIGFIAGGVLAATGVVLVLTAPKASPEKSAQVKLNVVGLPGRTFVGLEGTF